MMDNDKDLDAFFVMLDEVYDLMGKTPSAKVISAGAKAMFFRAVQQHSLEDVRAALDHHASNGTFTPVPKDINEYIQSRRPVLWIGADEAYALLPRGEDEPGLLNQVTAAALAAAAPFLAQRRPDENAARMAFRATYNRLVEQEKLANRAPRYWVSPAGSIEAQNEVRQEGIRLGLLNTTWAPAAAPQLGHSTPPLGAMEALKNFRLKELPPPGAEE